MALLTTKKVKLLLMVVCALTLFVLNSYSKIIDQEKEQLSLLNSKYGLTEVEVLNNSNKLSYMFVPNVMQANIFDIFKPKKELIVKINEDVFLLKLRTNVDTQEIAKQYESIDAVSYAEPNFNVELSEYNEEVKTEEDGLNIAEEFTADSNIVVAVIDSGVDINHKDLKDRIVSGYDFISNNKDVSDDDGHGTHIAGIIAGHSSAKIMPIKFTDGKEGKMSDLAKAIKFAVENNADVINLSLGLSEKSDLLVDSINYAFDNDIPVVAAAGNHNTSKKYYPAAYGKVIAVTGLTNDGDKLPQSNFGTWVDYSVKAQDILSTTPDNNYAYATGTSQAAPFLTAKIVEILDVRKISGIKSILLELNKISTKLNTGKFALLLGRKLE